MSFDSLKFEDLSLIEVDVTIKDEKYILREADEDTAVAYRNASVAGITLDDGKVTSLPMNIAGLQALLVSRCLFKLNTDGTPSNRPVSRGIIIKWPARVVRDIFEKAKEISELGEEPDTPETLQSQIDDLQDKLDKANAEEEIAKND